MATTAQATVNPPDDEGPSPKKHNPFVIVGIVVMVLLFLSFLGAVIGAGSDRKALGQANAKLSQTQTKLDDAVGSLDTAQAELAIAKRDLLATKAKLEVAQSKPSGATPEEMKTIVANATKHCRAASVTAAGTTPRRPVDPSAAVAGGASPVPQNITGRGEVHYKDPLTGTLTTGVVNSPQEALAWLQVQQNGCTQRLRASPGANPDASCNNLRKIN